MSVLAPPPSPSHSSTFDCIMIDSDVNAERMKQRTLDSDTRKRKAPIQCQEERNGTPSSPRSPQKANPDDSVDSSQQARKKTKNDPFLVELKGGKLVLKQKAFNWAQTLPVLQAIIAFQTFIASKKDVKEIPREHLHVVAKLVQESDKTLTELAKNVKSALIPEVDFGSEDSQGSSDGSSTKLTLASIQAAITSVAERKNYGLDPSSISTTSETVTCDSQLPAGLQVWRWEVTDVNLLPKENLEKLLARRSERQIAKGQAEAIFSTLSESEKKALLTKRKGRSGAMLASFPDESSASASKVTFSKDEVIVIDDDDDNDDEGAALKSSEALKESVRQEKSNHCGVRERGEKAEEHFGFSTPKDRRKGKETVELSPEKLKEIEEREQAKLGRVKAREAKKAEKEAKEAEKLKAKESQKKQASFFSAFIRAKSPTKDIKPSHPTPQNDFQRTFLPCQYKDLAPINRFAKPQTEIQVGASDKTKEELLQEFKCRARRRRAAQPLSRRGVHPPISVRDIKRIVTESDILGGNAIEEAKKSLEALKDQNKIQVKLLQFESDRRPGWYGTWTRSTNLIGPRRPLGQDPVALDYNYDSDADWEELGQVEGDDLQEVDNEDRDESGDSEVDSELDEWLEDDLEMEEIEEEGFAGSGNDEIVEVDAAGQPIISRTQAISSGRTPNILKPKKKKVKLLGRRFDSKLVPFSTGPHWETTLGQPIYENFASFRIEFLNDANAGLNPFTFASAPQDEQNAATEPIADLPTTAKPPAAAGGLLASLWASAGPDPTGAGKDLHPSMAAAANNITNHLTPTRPPKVAFPDTELPALLRMVQGSTKTRIGLIDDLKEKFSHLGKAASKSAIEAKVMQCAVREGKRANDRWVVKEEWRQRIGL
ncbi:hypothetical protein IE53DRAFT_197320 [Violaceomyces palustris]|uniref:Uncharacterized protein n=1 Tax=Violaceomyces palustris TaxID=1673888 RepID=A0ACD0NRI0_9BASI|nr:hypothetical protein IE53DRAFT_197320 [Violaceomyces palustris]